MTLSLGFDAMTTNSRRKDPNVITFTWPMQQRAPWWRRLIRLLVRHG
jgi:hypothetical protein